MTKDNDDRIDALRRRLVTTASQPIGMGNARQMARAYQEMMLELINIADELNAQSDISSAALNALKMQLAELLAKHEGET
jgi:hypothetical protein